MILFRCDRCGRAFRVEDQFAGGTADCEHCGRHIRIPRESDPEVVLVFKAGESEEGTPLTRAQVAEAFERGLLRPTDLVFENGLWRPLAVELRNVDNAAVAAEVKKGGLGLVLRSPDGSEVTIRELPLIPVKALGAQQASGKAGAPGEEAKEKKAGFRLIRTGDEEKGAEGKAGAEEEPAHPGKGVVVRRRRLVKKWTLITLQVVGGVIACWYGYKLGIGPLISAMRGKPTRVIVVNPVNAPAVAVLGWRHLKHDIPPGGITAFSLYVGMKEHQTLRIHPRTGKPVAFPVPLKPGASVIVNPGRRPLMAFQRGKITSLKLDRFAKTLADQLARNLPPRAALTILEQLSARIREACGEVVDEAVLDGDEYEIEGAPAPEGARGKPKPKARKRLLSATIPARIPLPAGWVEFNPLDVGQGKRFAVQAAVRLPARKFKLHKKFDVRIPQNAECRLQREAEEDSAGLTLANQAIDTRKGKLHGQWKYRAVHRAGEETWDWLWRFEGEGKLKKKKIGVILTLFRDNPVPRLELK